jgi:hypothetical protein
VLRDLQTEFWLEQWWSSFSWDVEAMVYSCVVLCFWSLLNDRHCCSWQYMPLDSLKAIPPTLSAYWKSFMAFPSCECNPILEHSFKGVDPSLQVS